MFSECDQYDKIVSAKGCDTEDKYHQLKLNYVVTALLLHLLSADHWNITVCKGMMIV